MRVLRKGLVVPLTLAMLAALATAALASVSVVGNPFADAVGHVHEREIALMAALGILRGDTGTANVRPDHPITRAEFTAVVVRMLDREGQAAVVASIQPAFKDQIPSWAWGYVNLATTIGIIKGYDDGTFRAARDVTHVEALAMLVRATGHEPGITGDWPFNYVLAGYERGITGDVQLFANLPATRGEVAHFVHNALFIKQGKVTAGVYNPEGAPALLAARTFAGVAGAFDPGAKTLVIGGTARNLADQVHVWKGISLAGLRGADVRAVANPAGRIVYIEPYAALGLVRGVFDRYETSAGVDRLVLADGSRVTYSPGITRLSVNEGAERALARNDAGLRAGDQVAIATSAGKATVVDAFRFNLDNRVVVDKLDASGAHPVRVRLDSGELIAVPGDATVVINGSPARSADLRADDVAYVATGNADAAQPAVRVEAVRQTVAGVFLSDRRVYTEAGKFNWHIRLRLPDGSERELKWYVQMTDASPPAPIAPGTGVSYALDRAGCARKALSAVLTTVHAKVLEVTAISGSAKLRVSLDVKGSTATYVTGAGTPADWAGHIGWIIEMGVNPVTGEIDGWSPRWRTGAGLYLGQVHSVDAAGNVMIQLYSPAEGSLTAVFRVSHPDLVAYREAADGSVGSFVAATSLTAATRVYFALHLDGRIIFILRKHNQASW